MIVLLISYPKSGNTWVRTFLSNYLFDESENPLENIKKIQAYPRFRHFDFLSSNDLKTIGDREQNYKFHLIAQERLNLNEKLNILKTHNYFGALNNYHFTNENNSFGFIYFVRDPRSVAVSLSLGPYTFKIQAIGMPSESNDGSAGEARPSFSAVSLSRLNVSLT